MPRRSPTTQRKATLPTQAGGEERKSRIVHLTQEFVNGLGPSEERYRITDSRVFGFSLRVEPSGRHSWQVRVSGKEGARQYWQTFGKVSDIGLREARERAEAIRTVASRDPNARQALGKDEAQKLPFERLAETWMDEDVSEKKPGTRKSYREKLDLYILPRFQGKKLREMDTLAVAIWHKDITNKGICSVKKDSTRDAHPAATTADRALGTLASFFKWVVKKKWALINPTKGVPRNGEHKIHRPLNDNARRKVGQAIQEMLKEGRANPIYLLGIQLSMISGLRREALTSLEWREVHLEGRYLRVVTKRTNPLDPQIIPLGPAGYSILKAIPRIGDSPYVFPGRDPSKPMAPGTFNAYWNKVRGRAGVHAEFPEEDRYGNLIEFPAVRPHDLRHTKTAKLAEKHENPMIGAIVGIKTSEVIDRYSHPVKKPVAEANEEAESLFAKDLGIEVDESYFEGNPEAPVDSPQRVQIVIQVGSWPHIPPRGPGQNPKQESQSTAPKPRRTKVEYPPDKVLQAMVLKRPVSVVAEELGATPKALEKWCKARGMKVRPRGYWAKKQRRTG